MPEINDIEHRIYLCGCETYWRLSKDAIGIPTFILEETVNHCGERGCMVRHGNTIILKEYTTPPTYGNQPRSKFKKMREFEFVDDIGQPDIKEIFEDG